MDLTTTRKVEQQHPLLFPEIYKRLFLYLSVEDLKAVRLVTHEWHSEATDLLSHRVHGILLHDKTEWKKFLKLLAKNTSSPKLSNIQSPFHSFTFFSSYPEDPSATPYKTAILDYMAAKYRLPRKTLWDKRFYSSYGEQIHELRIIQFNLYCEKSLRELRECLSINCPNLQRLTIQFQKELGNNNSSSSTTTTPSSTPSPSPQVISGGENVFFPPNEVSQRLTLGALKSFTFATDNKVYLNPNALEEFMTLMPELEEFSYRYTGAKKQWTLVRRVDIIDIICNIINAGHYRKLNSLDLDSDGTVLSGEDFKKISNLRLGSKKQYNLKKFACQVFIKTEFDWDYFCSWLCRINESLEVLNIQVRTHFPQLLSEQELPPKFLKVREAKLILDSNLRTFIKRLPSVSKFTGVYDNELVSLCSDEMMHGLSVCDGGSKSGSSSSNYDNDGSVCSSAKHLVIQGNEEFGLDIEWKCNVFCNISSFETDVYFDQDLRLIWTHLGEKLKRLVLHLRTIVPEQAFTGAGVPALLHTFDDKNVENHHDEDHRKRLDEYPNMGTMQCLEALEIYTGSRQDAYGSKFSASIIVYGVSLLRNLKRLVLPPSIPPRCLEESIVYLAELKELRYLSVCDDTFNSVLPFHVLKMDIPQLEIVVRYFQTEVQRLTGKFWKLERLVLPDFLPEHSSSRSKWMDKRHSAP